MPDDNADTQTIRIRDLNDAFRKAMVGDIYLTSGVAALPAETQAKVISSVKEFDAFDADSDPFHEHDFGAFDIAAQKFFWKIDAYDLNLEYGSENPADDSKTRRVLTIMLADEY